MMPLSAPCFGGHCIGRRVLADDTILAFSTFPQYLRFHSLFSPWRLVVGSGIPGSGCWVHRWRGWKDLAAGLSGSGRPVEVNGR